MGDFSAIQKYVQEVDENIILSKNEEILLLKHLEILTQHDILFSYLNQDLCELILLTDIKNNPKYISKYKEINFNDLIEMSKDISTPRKLKIYNQFVDFIFSEFNLQRKQKQSIDDESLEDSSSSSSKKELNFKVNSSIFTKLDKFDYEEDLVYKLNRYNITCEFNYTKPPGKIGVKNFMLYFNQRLKYFTDLLSSRIALDNVVRINQLKELQDTNTQVSLIGLVSDFQVTKNGHHIISLEDKSGQVNCFVNKDNQELIEKIKILCLDEGIGIIGKVGKGIIWTDDIVIPSPPNGRELKRIEMKKVILYVPQIYT